MVCIIIIGSEYKNFHKENATLSVLEYQILREMGINGRSEKLLKLVIGKLEPMGGGGAHYRVHGYCEEQLRNKL